MPAAAAWQTSPLSHAAHCARTPRCASAQQVTDRRCRSGDARLRFAAVRQLADEFRATEFSVRRKKAVLPMASRTARSLAGKRQRAESDEALDEALHLMAIQSAEKLARQHAQHLTVKLTWANLAELCVRALTQRLLAMQSDAELDALVDQARLLRERLQQRDDAKSGRVTTATRDGILLVSGCALVLQQLRRIRDGKLAPSFDNAGLASTLRSRWRRVGDVPPYVRSVVQAAIGKVLTSSATEGVRNFYSRILAHWTEAPQHDERRGVKIDFDSDDDF
jgi:hypothetical protein